MADVQQADLSYGTYMVLRKPLLFWLRWGGFLIAIIEVVAEARSPALDEGDRRNRLRCHLC
jgi:hypothetical protein